MNAQEIGYIIKEYHKLPYKAILISGVWGIGKSYAISKSLPDDSCIVSLFGKKSAADIYHNLFFEIFGRSKEKATATISTMFDSVTSALGGILPVIKIAGELKNTLCSIVSEKDLLFQVLKKLESQYIIVLDDLERLSKEIDFTEVFGLIEELKKIDKIKVIVIANIDELGSHKVVFDSYQEKVIDRIYQITEPSVDIDWAEMGIDADFAIDFTSHHKVKNLRTMEKAQNFYEDVRICGGIEDTDFLNSVRLLCYGVVVESVDEIYKEQISDAETKSKNAMELAFMHVRTVLQSRIARHYLNEAWSSSNLLGMIEKYYSESCSFDKNGYQAEYQVFLHSGDVSNYYKNEDEIREVVSHWSEWFASAQNAVELTRFADEAVGWNKILGESFEEIIVVYKNRLSEMLWDIAINKGKGILTIHDFSYHTEYREIKEASFEVVQMLRKRLVSKYIDELKISVDGAKAFEVSCHLRECYQNTYFRDLVEENCWKLLRDESFPIVSMTEEKYHTCYNILYILRTTDVERYNQFVEDLLTRCDKMAIHRIRNLNSAIDDK